MREKHAQDAITLIVGIWLILSPFVLGISGPEGTNTMPVTLNFVLSGAAAVILAVAALYYFQQWEEWLDVALGVWLAISPWVLGFTYSQIATWNAVACGVAIAAMGVWTTVEANSKHAI